VLQDVARDSLEAVRALQHAPPVDLLTVTTARLRGEFEALHEDAFGLADPVPVAQRGLEVVLTFGGGQRDRGVDGEDPGDRLGVASPSKACGADPYGFSAPSLSSAVTYSRSESMLPTPRSAAAAANRGQRFSAAMSGMRTISCSRMARRHGP
jgi:hypothetical protein